MTTFGFVLLLGALYAAYDIVKMLDNLRLKKWSQTIAETTAQVNNQGCWTSVKNLVLLPWTLFKEFGYAFVFVPWLGIYGMQNDLKVQGLIAVVLSIGLGIFAFKGMVRTFKLAAAHSRELIEAEEKKQEAPVTLWIQGDAKTEVVVLDNTTVIPNDAGRQLLMPGGMTTGVIYTALQTIVNGYVIYLFIATVLLA